MCTPLKTWCGRSDSGDEGTPSSSEQGGTGAPDEPAAPGASDEDSSEAGDRYSGSGGENADSADSGVSLLSSTYGSCTECLRLLPTSTHSSPCQACQCLRACVALVTVKGACAGGADGYAMPLTRLEDLSEDDFEDPADDPELIELKRHGPRPCVPAQTAPAWQALLPTLCVLQCCVHARA